MKKEVKSLTGFLCATVLTTVSGLHAQVADTSGIRKTNQQVVITATRSEKGTIDVPRSVTVLNGDSIRNAGYTSLGQVLAEQEGVFVMGTTQNPGQVQTIYTRGAGSNQTVILVDGIRISDPTSNDNGLDLNEISLVDVDRIEIVRGSHSTLYGSSAIGGVVNIITKKNETPGVHADASVTGGTFGASTSQLNSNVGVNYTHKSGFYVNLEEYSANVNGIDATIDTVSHPATYQETHRDNDNFSKNDFTAKVGFKNEKLDVFAGGRYGMQSSDIDKGAYTDDDNYTVDFKRWLANGGASYKFNDHFSASLIAGTTQMERKAVDDSSQVDAAGTTDHTYFSATYSGGTGTYEAQLNYRRKGISAVAGGGLFNEFMTAQTYYYSNGFFGPYEAKTDLDSLDISVNTSYEFVHVDIDGSLFSDSLSKFRLGLGLRNVSHDLFGSKLVYEVAPSVKLNENALLYASYSTGFNAPSLYQLYSPEADYTSGITRGNKTLRPEESASFELGIKQRLSNRFSFGVAYFHTVVKNSIDYVYLWNSATPVDSLSYLDYRGDTYINIGKQTNQGVEISVSAQLTEKLFFSGNISLISGRLEYDPASIDTSHTHNNHVQLYSNGAFLTKDIETVGLVRRPNAGNLMLAYSPVKKLRLTLSAHYVGPRSDVYYASSLGPYGALSTAPVGDYTLVDASVRYEIFKNFSAQVFAKNIFDVKYTELFGYNTRGRGFYVNLHYNF